MVAGSVLSALMVKYPTTNFAGFDLVESSSLSQIPGMLCTFMTYCQHYIPQCNNTLYVEHYVDVLVTMLHLLSDNAAQQCKHQIDFIL